VKKNKGYRIINFAAKYTCISLC